jgi:hypothetical protein
LALAGFSQVCSGYGPETWNRTEQGLVMFKALIPAFAVAAALVAPTSAHAQDNNSPVTRAQVEAELVALDQVGFDPATDRADYPRRIQAAEQRVEARQSAVASAFGSSTGSTSQSGGASTQSASN